MRPLSVNRASMVHLVPVLAPFGDERRELLDEHLAEIHRTHRVRRGDRRRRSLEVSTPNREGQEPAAFDRACRSSPLTNDRPSFVPLAVTDLLPGPARAG
jgi:hypothetical protein